MVTQKAWLWALSARLQFGNRGVRLVLLGFDLPPARPAALVQRILFGHTREDAVDFRISVPSRSAVRVRCRTSAGFVRVLCLRASAIPQ